MKEASPTMQELSAVIREFVGLRSGRHVTAHTRIDRDLGITGDDGIELLRTVETRFDVSVGLEDERIREVFGLGENEYLFGSEGLEIPFLSGLSRRITGNPAPVIRDLTVGELLAAIQKSMARPQDNGARGDRTERPARP